MFHIYFLGSNEGLIFDVANANFDVALWNPLQDYLEIKDVRFHTGVTVTAVHAGERLSVRGPDGLSSPATALCWPPMCRACSASSQARRNWVTTAGARESRRWAPHHRSWFIGCGWTGP